MATTSKQDRQPARTASQLERKWDWGKTFAEVYGLIDDVQTETLKAVDSLDKKLDHEEVFNRLTNYGKVQGIYRSDNDDVYINASYIKSGLLSADRIDADSLKVKAANITGLLTANQIKLGGVMSLYQTLDSNNLAGTLGYANAQVGAVGSSTYFSGPAIGIIAQSDTNSYAHAMLMAPNGNIAIAGYGDVFIGSSLGRVNTLGTALSFNGVNIAYNTSDRRMKKNIDYGVTDKLIAAFDGLKPVTFELDNEFDEGQNHIGFIAQDVVEAVASADLGNALIATDCNGMYALNYGEITAVLTAKIKQLESRLNELEGAS